MRITQQSMLRQLQSGVRARQEAVARAQAQALTGRRLTRMSDDPVSGAQVLRLEQAAGDLAQFRRNGDLVRTRLTAEGVALRSLRTALDEARSVAMNTTAHDPADPARVAALAATRALREQVLGLSNTRVGGEFIFAGARTDQPAFLADATYQGDTSVRRAEIHDGVIVPVGHAGEPLFGDALRSLDALITALETGTGADVANAVPALSDASLDAISAEGESGGWLKQIQTASLELAEAGARYLERRDGIRDADPALAILELQSEQAALERAYAVVGRVMQTNLTDYLR